MQAGLIWLFRCRIPLMTIVFQPILPRFILSGLTDCCRDVLFVVCDFLTSPGTRAYR